MSEGYGAKIIWRPKQDPDATANVPICHAIRKIRALGYPLKTMLTLLPTAPLRQPYDLDNMVRQYKADPCNNIAFAVPLKEIVLFEDDGGNRGHCILGDKKYRYIANAGGTCVSSADWWLEASSKVPLSDTEVDNDIVTYNNTLHTDWRYYRVKEWQMWDIDYREDFDLIQILMEYYILKGRGVKVYGEYGGLK
jgi:CMP-N-acetylneuraminic acid synthetase